MNVRNDQLDWCDNNLLSFYFSDAIVSQVLDELGLSIGDEISGELIVKNHWVTSHNRYCNDLIAVLKIHNCLVLFFTLHYNTTCIDIEVANSNAN